MRRFASSHVRVARTTFTRSAARRTRTPLSAITAATRPRSQPIRRVRRKRHRKRQKRKRRPLHPTPKRQSERRVIKQLTTTLLPSIRRFTRDCRDRRVQTDRSDRFPSAGASLCFQALSLCLWIAWRSTRRCTVCFQIRRQVL
jgi:hypothetical protein